MKNSTLQLPEPSRLWDWYIEKLRKTYLGNLCLNVYSWKNFKETQEAQLACMFVNSFLLQWSWILYISYSSFWTAYKAFNLRPPLFHSHAPHKAIITPRKHNSFFGRYFYPNFSVFYFSPLKFSQRPYNTTTQFFYYLVLKAITFSDSFFITGYLMQTRASIRPQNSTYNKNITFNKKRKRR